MTSIDSLELTKKNISLFWEKVALTANPDKCWHWMASKNRLNGYGAFFIQKKLLKAHRVSFFISSGIDPKESLVCHNCDNPSCVNPKHLFLSTHLGNIRDMWDKGRGAIGENRNQKLKTDQVQDIRDCYGKGVSKHDLAQKYSVTYKTITQVVIRDTWKHV